MHTEIIEAIHTYRDAVKEHTMTSAVCRLTPTPSANDYHVMSGLHVDAKYKDLLTAIDKAMDVELPAEPPPRAVHAGAIPDGGHFGLPGTVPKDYKRLPYDVACNLGLEKDSVYGIALDGSGSTCKLAFNSVVERLLGDGLEGVESPIGNDGE